jgi:hypothetical protein
MMQMFDMILRDPKVMASLQAALLFLIVANPATYRLVQMIFGGLFKVANSTTGCPSAMGLLLHAVVFGLLSYVLMMLKRPAVVVVAEEAGEMVMDAAEDVAVDVVKAEKAIAAEVMGREGFMMRRREKSSCMYN